MIKLFKLISGEEVIGNMAEVTDTFFAVENPLQIMEVVLPDGSQTTFLKRWLPTSADHRVKIFSSHMMTSPLRVSELVEKHYQNSLRFAQDVADPNFAEGLIQASEEIDTYFKSNSEPEAPPPQEEVSQEQDLSTDFKRKLFLSAFIPGSDRKDH